MNISFFLPLAFTAGCLAVGCASPAEDSDAASASAVISAVHVNAVKECLAAYDRNPGTEAYESEFAATRKEMMCLVAANDEAMRKLDDMNRRRFERSAQATMMSFRVEWDPLCTDLGKAARSPGSAAKNYYAACGVKLERAVATLIDGYAKIGEANVPTTIAITDAQCRTISDAWSRSLCIAKSNGALLEPISTKLAAATDIPANTALANLRDGLNRASTAASEVCSTLVGSASRERGPWSVTACMSDFDNLLASQLMDAGID